MASLEESRRRKRRQRMDKSLVKKQLEEFNIDLNNSDDSDDSVNNDNDVVEKENIEQKEQPQPKHSSSPFIIDRSSKDNNQAKEKGNGTIAAKDVVLSDYLNQRDDGTYIIDPTERDKVPSVYRTNVQLYAILKKHILSRKISDYLNIAIAEKLERDGLLSNDDVKTLTHIISNMM